MEGNNITQIVDISLAFTTVMYNFCVFCVFVSSDNRFNLVTVILFTVKNNNSTMHSKICSF